MSLPDMSCNFFPKYEVNRLSGIGGGSGQTHTHIDKHTDIRVTSINNIVVADLRGRNIIPDSNITDPINCLFQHTISSNIDRLNIRT